MVAGYSEMVHGAVTLPGGGVMVAEQGCHFLQAIGGGLLDTPSHSGMQLLSLCPQQPLVRRLLHQGMSKPVCAFGLSGYLGEQAGCAELCNHLLELAVETSHCP